MSLNIINVITTPRAHLMERLRTELDALATAAAADSGGELYSVSCSDHRIRREAAEYLLATVDGATLERNKIITGNIRGERVVVDTGKWVRFSETWPGEDEIESVVVVVDDHDHGLDNLAPEDSGNELTVLVAGDVANAPTITATSTTAE